MFAIALLFFWPVLIPRGAADVSFPHTGSAARRHRSAIAAILLEDGVFF
jgi:hypothetical protein